VDGSIGVPNSTIYLYLSMRPKLYQVRVYRKVEVWVEVKATSPIEAETEAYKVPGVVNVFPKSAIMSSDRVEDVENAHVSE
jgi:hypothetical protein